MKALILSIVLVTLSGCASVDRFFNEPQIKTGSYIQCTTYGATTNCYPMPVLRRMTPAERSAYNRAHGTNW